MSVPTNPGWEGLGFVMESQGSEIAPGRIAAEEFDATGLEHEAEEQPAQEPKDGARCYPHGARASPKPAREQSERSEEYCQKSGFQEQDVPLDSQELAADSGK